MLLSVTPVVYGGRKRWVIGASLHVLGGAAGGFTVGLLLAPLALLPIPTAASAALVVLVIVAALSDMGVTQLSYPSPRRQVPEYWRKQLPPDLFFFLYGYGLGAVWFTKIRTVAVFALAVLSGATGNPGLVIAAFTALGATRALVVVLPAAFFHPQSRALVFTGRVTAASSGAGVVGGAAATLLASAALVSLL